MCLKKKKKRQTEKKAKLVISSVQHCGVLLGCRAIFVLKKRKTDRQTDRQTDRKKAKLVISSVELGVQHCGVLLACRAAAVCGNLSFPVACAAAGWLIKSLAQVEAH